METTTLLSQILQSETFKHKKGSQAAVHLYSQLGNNKRSAVNNLFKALTDGVSFEDLIFLSMTSKKYISPTPSHVAFPMATKVSKTKKPALKRMRLLRLAKKSTYTEATSC